MVEASPRTLETTGLWRRLEPWLRPEPRGRKIEVKELCFEPRRRRFGIMRDGFSAVQGWLI